MTYDTSAPLLQIQRGLFAILNTPLGGKFYDEIPEKVKYPYTCVDSMASTTEGAKGVLAFVVLVVLKTYGRDSGGSEDITAIQETIVAELTTNRLAMTNWRESRIEPVKITIRKQEKDPGLAYEGMTSFNIYVQRSRT